MESGAVGVVHRRVAIVDSTVFSGAVYKFTYLLTYLLSFYTPAISSLVPLPTHSNMALHFHRRIKPFDTTRAQLSAPF